MDGREALMTCHDAAVIFIYLYKSKTLTTGLGPKKLRLLNIAFHCYIRWETLVKYNNVITLLNIYVYRYFRGFWPITPARNWT